MTPKISIIIPTYNRGFAIGRAIESVLNQNLYNIEIIIIDDGSIDFTEDIVQKYLENDKRIIYVKKQNQGVSTARNVGIDLARGDYVTFLDSDDEFTNGYFNFLFNKNFFNKNYEIIQTFSKDPYHGNFDISTLSHENQIVYVLKNLTGGIKMFPIHTFIYKLEFIRGNNINFNKNISIGEDRLFLLKCFSFVKKYRYYHFESLIINTGDWDSITRYRNNLKVKSEYLKSRIIILKFIILNNPLYSFSALVSFKNSFLQFIFFIIKSIKLK